jgi:hypothetical protein
MNSNDRVAETILAQTIVESNLAQAAADEAQRDASLFDTKANINSPTFTGVPAAPTAADMNNSTQLATTAYLDRLRGTVNGIATLDAAGLIPASQLPGIALTTVFTVSSQAAMLALDAQPGDLAVRTDISETFILTTSPPSVLANWTLLLFAAPVTSVAGLTGAITATGLTASLNAFTGDAGSGGLKGLVPAPAAGYAAANRYLKADGTFAIIAVAQVTGAAPLASPTFSGTPGGPTATVGTNTGQFATTAFVQAALGALPSYVTTFNSRTGAVSPTTGDYTVTQVTGAAPLASPTFTGVPAAPTAVGGTSTTQLATTAFVTAAVAASVVSFNGRTGAVSPASGDYAVGDVTGAAPLASPTFTGVPAAPTATGGTNSTQLATTAFVTAAVASKAPLASPALTGVPTAPTAATATNTTQLATTAFVQAVVATVPAGVTSFNSRTGAVAPASGDYAVGDVTGAAPLASPTFTGVPAAPTAAGGTNTTQLATTAFVTAAISGFPAVPTSSTLPVGTVAMMYYNAISTLANSATTAGSNLQSACIDVNSGVSTVSQGAAQAGTWRNISGTTFVGNASPGTRAGLCVRIS